MDAAYYPLKFATFCAGDAANGDLVETNRRIVLIYYSFNSLVSYQNYDNGLPQLMLSRLKQKVRLSVSLVKSLLEPCLMYNTMYVIIGEQFCNSIRSTAMIIKFVVAWLAYAISDQSVHLWLQNPIS